MYLYLKLLAVFLIMNHQCMVMNHLNVIISYLTLILGTNLESKTYLSQLRHEDENVTSIRHVLHHRLGKSK